MDFLIDSVISGTVDGCFDRAGLKLVEIEILLTLWPQFKNVKMFFLTELNKIPKLLSSFLLSICSPIVYSLPNYETLLLGKSIQIFLVQRISFILSHLRKFVRRS